MNISEVGAVGELIGGIGVIVTLLYLAVQVRQNAKQQKFSSTSNLQEQLSQAYDPAYFENNMSAYRKGLADEQLDPDEYMTFYFLSFRALAHFHQIFASHKKGYIDDSILSMNRGVLLNFLGAPGMRKYWLTVGREIGFPNDFVEWVNELAENAHEVPVAWHFWNHQVPGPATDV